MTRIEAWGEEKSIAAWARDARCSIDARLLRTRLRELGWEPERAISEPAADRTRLWEAWGEERTCADWARDERCAVGEETLRQRLYRLGWPPEEAIRREPGQDLRKRGPRPQPKCSSCGR
jgi:hypothetical protein